MQNMKSYFSSWKPFWKSSHTETLTLAPSNINFTNSSLGNLRNSIIDEKLMIEISRKLLDSISPPKLQIWAHNNQWFALNNSHLLVYRQLERIGLCDTVVCDIIRSQDIPVGIRQTLIPTVEQQRHEPINDEEPQNQDEVVYCSDMQADSCGCLDDDDSLATGDESDEDENSDDEQPEWPGNGSLSVGQHLDFDEDEIEHSSKEMQCLL